MQIHGWGRYPIVDSEVTSPISVKEAIAMVNQDGSLVPRGLARSYGDSSLGGRVLETNYLNHFESFDEQSGVLICEAGVSLEDILRVSVPLGWFLPVTPGTRYVTVGGAIASDVHGKNHHIHGTFGAHVMELRLLLGSGEQVVTSPTVMPDLFRATCGGMGLTGVILSASLQLKPIRSSDIEETTIGMPNLDTVLTGFSEHERATYSVAWIDCLARGKSLGRSLLTLGEHAENGPLRLGSSRSITVPCNVPPFLLNDISMRAFNTAYYAKSARGYHTRTIPFEPFFYPLDKLRNWNRLYGKPGFVQYQFVLPREAGVVGLRDVLERIAASGRGPTLAVLKAFGAGNDNYLSFPCPGYTLALDFKFEPSVFDLLNTLDRVVLDYGGRLYLTKDARMSEEMFKKSYHFWPDFEAVREKYHAVGKFTSTQSRRLGLQ